MPLATAFKCRPHRAFAGCGKTQEESDMRRMPPVPGVVKSFAHGSHTAAQTGFVLDRSIPRALRELA